jgi:hypothetical protein
VFDDEGFGSTVFEGIQIHIHIWGSSVRFC